MFSSTHRGRERFPDGHRMRRVAALLGCAWLGLGVGAGTARADCPDPAALVDQVEQAVLDTRFDDAQRATDQAEIAFGCTGSADSVLLARLWLAQGAQAHVEGDPITRDRAFASAWRLSPSTWTDAFGTELQQKWLDAPKFDHGSGNLDVEGLISGQVVRVDGRPVTVPTRLDSGLYLVQAEDGAPPTFAQIVLVPDDGTLVVRVDQDALQQAIDTAPADSSTATVPAPHHHRGRWAWLATAGTSAALAGTSAILATAATHNVDAATTSEQINRAYARQHTWTYASYSLTGLSALTIGVGLAW